MRSAPNGSTEIESGPDVPTNANTSSVFRATEISISLEPSPSAVFPGAKVPPAMLIVIVSAVVVSRAEMSIWSVLVTSATPQGPPPKVIADPDRSSVAESAEPTVAVTVAVPES